MDSSTQVVKNNYRKIDKSSTSHRGSHPEETNQLVSVRKHKEIKEVEKEKKRKGQHNVSNYS